MSCHPDELDPVERALFDEMAKSCAYYSECNKTDVFGRPFGHCDCVVMADLYAGAIAAAGLVLVEKKKEMSGTVAAWRSIDLRSFLIGLSIGVSCALIVLA